MKSNSGAGLLSRIQESAKITDDEGALGLDHLAFQSIRFTIGQIFEGEVLKPKKRSRFLKIQDLSIGKMV